MKNFKLFIEATSDLAALVVAVVHGNYDRTPRLIVADHLDELGDTSLSALLRLTARKAEGEKDLDVNLFNDLLNKSQNEIKEMGHKVQYSQGISFIDPTDPIGRTLNGSSYELRQSGVYDNGILIPFNDLPEGVLRAILLIYAYRMWETISPVSEMRRGYLRAMHELRNAILPGGDVPVTKGQLTDLLVALKDIESIFKQESNTIDPSNVKMQLRIAYISCFETVEENMVPVKLRPLMKEITDFIHTLYNSLSKKKDMPLPRMPNYRN